MRPSIKLPTFKRGDEVTWTSQASGYSKKKRGVIQRALKEGDTPNLKEHAGLRKNGAQSCTPRDHRSYIVKTADGKLYWPLVKYLKPVKSNGKGSK